MTFSKVTWLSPWTGSSMFGLFSLYDTDRGIGLHRVRFLASCVMEQAFHLQPPPSPEYVQSQSRDAFKH